MRKGRQSAVLSLVLLVLLGAAGCGGSDGDTEAPDPSQDVAYPKGPTRQFYDPGDDNAVQLYGHEAAPALRRQIGSTVQAWLRARAAGNWDRECRYLSQETVKYATDGATTVGQREVRSCDAALAILAVKGQKVSRRYNMAGSVPSVRLGEGHGYAQYHGNDGRDWVVPVKREDGAWKVSTLDPVDRLK